MKQRISWLIGAIIPFIVVAWIGYTQPIFESRLISVIYETAMLAIAIALTVLLVVASIKITLIFTSKAPGTLLVVFLVLAIAAILWAKLETDEFLQSPHTSDVEIRFLAIDERGLASN